MKVNLLSSIIQWSVFNNLASEPNSAHERKTYLLMKKITKKTLLKEELLKEELLKEELLKEEPLKLFESSFCHKPGYATPLIKLTHATA